MREGCFAVLPFSPPLLWQHNLWTSVAVQEGMFAMYSGTALNTSSVHVNVCVEAQEAEKYALG